MYMLFFSPTFLCILLLMLHPRTFELSKVFPALTIDKPICALFPLSRTVEFGSVWYTFFCIFIAKAVNGTLKSEPYRTVPVWSSLAWCTNQSYPVPWSLLIGQRWGHLSLGGVQPFLEESLSTLCDKHDRKGQEMPDILHCFLCCCHGIFIRGIHCAVFLRCHVTYIAGTVRIPRPAGNGTVASGNSRL